MAEIPFESSSVGNEKNRFSGSKKRMNEIHKFLSKIRSRYKDLSNNNSNLTARTESKPHLEKQVPEYVHENIPENKYLTNLGSKKLISLDAMVGLPEESDESFGVIADLIANNRFDVETEMRLKELHLNGHLLGVGTASIFSMLEAFDFCKSFTSLDIHPTPVAIGRLLDQLFITQPNFEEFLKALSNEQIIKNYLISIGLPAKYLDSATKTVLKAATQYMDATMRHFKKIDGIHIIQFELRNLLPLEVIRLHYDELKIMAQSGRLNFIQADFYDPNFWKELRANAPGIEQDNNLIYLSNALDHVWRSKALNWEKRSKKDEQEVILVEDEKNYYNHAAESNFSGMDNTKFVYTLNSEEYLLRLQDKAPIFDMTDDGPVVKQDKVA